MSFYTYDYIAAHSQFGNTVWYVLSFLALAALLFVSVKYCSDPQKLDPLCLTFGGHYRSGLVFLYLFMLLNPREKFFL